MTEFFEEVGPYYAAPGNMGLTAILLRATSPNVDMMKHFMTKLAPQYDLTSQLHLITIPTLVLVGAYDWVCPPRASRAIARSISQSKMIIFDNSGHFLFSEEPREIPWRCPQLSCTRRGAALKVGYRFARNDRWNFAIGPVTRYSIVDLISHDRWAKDGARPHARHKPVS